MADGKDKSLADSNRLSADVGVQFFPCLVRGDGNGNRKEGFNVSEFQGFKDVKPWDLKTLKPDLAMQTNEEVIWLTSP